jgi:hypothetical protein
VRRLFTLRLARNASSYLEEDLRRLARFAEYSEAGAQTT